MRFDFPTLPFLLPLLTPTIVSSELFSDHRITNGKLSLILVGNIGAGKSFIGNILVGREVFNSRTCPTSVTSEAQIESIDLNPKIIVIDLPGFDDPDPESLQSIKQQIKEAIETKSSSQLLLCVLSVASSNGRVRPSDQETCNLIRDSYGFGVDQTIVIVNQVRERELESFIPEVVHEFQSTPHFRWVDSSRTVFLPMITSRNEARVIETFRSSISSLLTKSRLSHHPALTPLETKKEQRIRLEEERVAKEREMELKQKELLRVQNFPKFTFATSHTEADHQRAQGASCLSIGETRCLGKISAPSVRCPNIFGDNHLCVTPSNAMDGWRWSAQGSIQGMNCLQFYEDTPFWKNNYLCRPHSDPATYHYRWSHGGQIPGMTSCIQIHEPVEYWNDNYFCVSFDSPSPFPYERRFEHD
jgi:GTPase Era involved in 16S rRNA processing